MSRDDDREPDALPEHARRRLDDYVRAHDMPVDAFARVHAGLRDDGRGRARRSSRATAVAIAVLVAATVMLVLGLQQWQSTRIETPAPSLVPDTSVPHEEVHDVERRSVPPPATLPASPTATAELDAQRSTPDAQRSTLNAQRSTLNAQRSTPDAQRSTPDAPRDEPTSTLAAERELLARAQAALTANAPQRALQVIAEHRRRFPAGALVHERDAIAAIARCRTRTVGDAAEADAFAARHPGSPLLSRVRDACVRSSDTP